MLCNAGTNALLSWFINGKWCEAMHFLAVVLCLAFSVAWDQVSECVVGQVWVEPPTVGKGRGLGPPSKGKVRLLGFALPLEVIAGGYPTNSSVL